MSDFFKFQWLCLKEAWAGCWSSANQLGAVVGGLILAAALYLFRDWLEVKNLLEAPTKVPDVVFFTALLAGASVIMAFAVIFVARLLITPARLYWKQHKRAKKLEAELSAAAAVPGDGPDWPIHEVFSYLEPDVLDRPEDNLWQKAGDKIRDAFSLGQLKVWGRPYKTKLGDWIGERAAMRLIDRKYWEKAFFTYFFFDSSAQDQTHVYSDRDTGRPAYTDLQVNRAEVLKLWPGEPDDLADSYANVRVADEPEVVELFRGRERTKLIGLLQSEKLTTWARLSAGIAADVAKVDGEIWSTHTFLHNPKTDQNDPGTINQTYMRVKGGYNSSHYDVCLNFAQLKRAWPHLKIRRSACDIR